MLELGGPLGSTNTSCLILQTINMMLIEYVTVPATVPSNLFALSHFVLTTNRHFDRSCLLTSILPGDGKCLERLAPGWRAWTAFPLPQAEVDMGGGKTFEVKGMLRSLT